MLSAVLPRKPLQMKRYRPLLRSRFIRSKLEGFAFAPAKLSLQQLADFEREEREKWKSYVDIAQIEVQ